MINLLSSITFLSVPCAQRQLFFKQIVDLPRASLQFSVVDVKVVLVGRVHRPDEVEEVRIVEIDAHLRPSYSALIKELV